MLIEPITPIDSQLDGMINMATLNTTELAEKFETTPRTLRKLLRADARAAGNADSLPGKGARYSIEGKAVAPLKKRFAAWQVEQAKANAERAAAKVAEAEAVETD
jgi:hypothetical protein